LQEQHIHSSSFCPFETRSLPLHSYRSILGRQALNNILNTELIVDASSSQVVLALLEDKKLVELNRDEGDHKFSVGDLYLGRVKKVMPGLNAAFVDVGYEKDAFLHYLDLGPQYLSLAKFTKSAIHQYDAQPLLNDFKFEKDIEKNGKITKVLASNQNVLIQVAKEPISTKGPRVTCELSLAGRFLVLIPFSDRISISSKISSSEERTRLKRLIQSIRPKNFGVIIRTVAENQKVAELDADLKELVKRWTEAHAKLKSTKPPKRVLGELNRTSAILRDILSPSFNSIYINNTTMLEEVKGYIKTIAPDKEKIVKFYNGKDTIFEHFGVEKQIKALFGKYVTMKSRAYLIIEHTEALHVIDVNSGSRTNSKESQENNALSVNLDAAEEIALQLKLRDMGGIIVVDFIDMYIADNRKKLFEKLKSAMAKDRAKHKILPPSRFGLVQITRQRVRPEMDISTNEKCPACDGSGEIQASVLLIDKIESTISYFFQEQNEPSLTLRVHPFIEAYLTKGFMSVLRKWYLKYKKRLKVKADTSCHFMEFRFFNKNEEEIKI